VHASVVAMNANGASVRLAVLLRRRFVRHALRPAIIMDDDGQHELPGARASAACNYLPLVNERSAGEECADLWRCSILCVSINSNSLGWMQPARRMCPRTRTSERGSESANGPEGAPAGMIMMIIFSFPIKPTRRRRRRHNKNSRAELAGRATEKAAPVANGGAQLEIANTAADCAPALGQADCIISGRPAGEACLVLRFERASSAIWRRGTRNGRLLIRADFQGKPLSASGVLSGRRRFGRLR
jgi:hypothetical protein